MMEPSQAQPPPSSDDSQEARAIEPAHGVAEATAHALSQGPSLAEHQRLFEPHHTSNVAYNAPPAQRAPLVAAGDPGIAEMSAQPQAFGAVSEFQPQNLNIMLPQAHLQLSELHADLSSF